MEYEQTFKTKTGFCHILPDRIVLTRDGVVGNVSKIAVGNSMLRILVIYGLLSFGLFYFAFTGFQNGEIVQPIIFGLLFLYLIFVIVKSINNSATPIIVRDKIRRVEFKRGIKGLTRPRFEILFENEDGKIKKRLVMLPGSLNNNQDETEKALKIMIDEGLIEAFK